jgi:hypothetical protein
MNIRLEDQSLRLLVGTGRTGDESAANAMAVYLEECSQVESSSFLQTSDSPSFCSASFLSVMACRFRAKSVAFDLAADFLYSIVIPIDLMTLQATDIRYTLEKLAGVPLGDAKDASFCAGIDKDLSLFTNPCNYLRSNTLGV